MRIEIVRPTSQLERDIWKFSLSVDYGLSCIFLDRFSHETKRSTRCKKWTPVFHWEWADRRNNNVPRPVIPADVEAEVRKLLKDFIMTLPIRGE